MQRDWDDEVDDFYYTGLPNYMLPEPGWYFTTDAVDKLTAAGYQVLYEEQLVTTGEQVRTILDQQYKTVY